jgi:hypothetical protein
VRTGRRSVPADAAVDPDPAAIVVVVIVVASLLSHSSNSAIARRNIPAR